eukprot:30841_5
MSGFSTVCGCGCNGKHVSLDFRFANICVTDDDVQFGVHQIVQLSSTEYVLIPETISIPQTSILVSDRCGKERAKNAWRRRVFSQ